MNVDDESGHILFLFEVHPGHGFIEQEKFWFEGKSPSQFDTFSHTIREETYHFFSIGFHLQKVDNIFYHFSVLDLFPSGRTEVYCTSQSPPFQMEMPGCH